MGVLACDVKVGIAVSAVTVTPATIRNTDRILVLKSGRIIKSGTFNELGAGTFCPARRDAIRGNARAGKLD